MAKLTYEDKINVKVNIKMYKKLKIKMYKKCNENCRRKRKNIK